jgi:MFS family permease
MTRDYRLMLTATFFWGAGEGLFIYLFPLYLEKLGATPVFIGAIIGAAMLGLVLAHVPAGWLADRFDRRRLLVLAWGLGTLSAAAMYLAPNLGWYSAALVAYIFSGFAAAPISAYLTHARGTWSVQRALAFYSASYAAGAVLSPALGGQAARLWGLRSIFGLAALVFSVSTAAVLLLHSQPAPARQPGVNRYRVLLTSRPLLRFLALMLPASLAFQIGLPLASNFLADVRRLDVGVIGLLGSFNALGMLMLNAALGHREPRRAFLVSQVLMALSLGLLLATGQPVWVALAFLVRGSWGLARAMCNALVGRVVGSADLGLAYGLTETVMAVAVMSAPPLAGLLYVRGPSLPFEAGLGMLAVTLPLAAWLAPRQAAGLSNLPRAAPSGGQP